MISLMAVTVERVFPLAFCHVDKSSTIEQPWNEEEDAVRADKWKVRCDVCLGHLELT